MGAEGAESKRTDAVTVTVIAEPAPEPTAPVITITAQPTAPAALAEGIITGSLTVEANATEGATLHYQWYGNTTASNAGGTPIDGAVEARYILPTNLSAGKHYYYCVVSAADARDKTTDAVILVVAPEPRNGRVTWKDGRYILTIDPTDAGLFFQFGSVVGIFSGNGATLTLPATTTDTFDAGDIAWNPAGDMTDMRDVPQYSIDDLPAPVDAAYHTAARVKAGVGDPCRLVGLDLTRIKSTATGSLAREDIDNGQWRLPTYEENLAFSGQADNADYTDHWTTLNGVNGGIFPNTTDGTAATFLPATGRRTYAGQTDGHGGMGAYWSSTPSSTLIGSAHFLGFGSDYVNPRWLININTSYPVRCIRQ